jgi:RNA polymerase sigma-70 factor (ECF subfamily)
MQSVNEQDTDESLMLAIQSGKHQAFVVLVNRHTSRFYAVAYRILSQKEDAEDVVQEAFLKLWNKPKTFKVDKGVKFTTWFYKVITNLSIDRIRKNSKLMQAKKEIDFIDEKPIAESKFLHLEQTILINEAILSLPKNQMLALNLCFYEGISNKEAADILGVSPKAIESLLMRAKKNIRQILLKKGVLE